MLRCPDIPLLPGTVFRDITKNRFHRSQHWTFNGTIPILADGVRCGIGGEPIATLSDPTLRIPSLYPPNVGPKIPAWLAYDKKVLCFSAYFKETLNEVYMAPYQVRKVKIYFYLEDDTMQVSEPRTDNSGIPQGCLVSRQRIPHPAPRQHEFITALDINVNQTLQIFDRVYHITACNLFTREFLNRLGISVPDPVDMPLDPSTELRKKMDAAKQAKKPSAHVDTFGQFLENDRKILRFYGYWDDRRNAFGDIRDLIVYYFLANDTIEIKEVLPQNSGRDGGGIFLKRGKVPRDFTGMPPMGDATPVTVLNVLGGGLKGGRYIIDPLGTEVNEHKFFMDRDLTLGAIINIYGREVQLLDCDEFTKNYYRKKYGIDDFPRLSRPIENHKIEAMQERELPPFNGWGSHEDSEGNCRTVEPKPPKTDFKKFINLDRYLLRFGAKMLSTIPENNERVFIIVYYLADDTISIYELAVRNSGFEGGTFASRAKFLLPDQEILTPQRPRTYLPQHFYIGATVVLNDFKFYLATADEFAICYMEQHWTQFACADVNRIMSKIREAVRPIYKNFVASTMPYVSSVHLEDGGDEIAVICGEDFKAALIAVLGDKIVDHEIISLCRHFSAEHKRVVECDRDRVRSVIHWELSRKLWNDMDRFKEHIYHLDPTNSGFMNETRVLSAIRAVRLPIDIALVKNLFSVVHRNALKEIDVCDLLSFFGLVYTGCPVVPVNVLRGVCPDLPFTQVGRLVKWNDFLQMIDLEEALKLCSE